MEGNGVVGVGMVDYWRQAGVVSTSRLRETEVVVVGAGGIGSPVTMALCKMGVGKVTVYDHDVVEAHNVPNQMYGPQDVGKAKVVALAEHCARQGAGIPEARYMRFGDQSLGRVTVCAVDSMEGRRELWERVKSEPVCGLWVETRMGAELGRVCAGDPLQREFQEWYEGTLYSDAEAVEAPCTERAVVYTGWMVAALVAAQVKRWVMGQPVPRDTVFDFVSNMYVVDGQRAGVGLGVAG